MGRLELSGRRREVALKRRHKLPSPNVNQREVALSDARENTERDPQGSGEPRRENPRSLAGYVVSLPERMIRATAAGGGGLLLEAADHILPPVARGSKFYQCTIARPFRITVEFVGGVEGRFPAEMAAPELVKRKVAGNVVEAGCVFTVGFSPLWFLAAASDVTNGTRAYLDAFVKELKGVGVLPENTDVSTVNDLLTILDGASAQAADTIDIPPVAIADMRDAVELLRENAELIPGPQRLSEVFEQMNDAAREQKHSLLAVSTLVAAGAVGAGMQMGSDHIFSFYAESLNNIRSEGASKYLGRISQPYVDAAARHMDPSSPALTPKLIQALIDQVPTSGPDANNWTGMR